MSTLINLTPESLMTTGSSSLSSADDDNTLGTVGLTSIGISTTALTTGDQTIGIHVRAEELNMTRSYVTSLSEEEKNEILDLLTIKEEQLIQEDVKKLTKS